MNDDPSASVEAKDNATKTPARRLTRAEKNVRTRAKILRAAAKLIGENGYSGAPVSRITAEANIAQGTFYNYFTSQQDLFDQLLPALGAELLGFIRARTLTAVNSVERERLGFMAFFEFLKLRPEFYRILYEAEVFAPDAYMRHMNIISHSYVRTLERDFDSGHLTLRHRSDIEPIAFSLMAARQYLCMQYARRNGKIVDLPESVVDAYMSLVNRGIFSP